MLNKMVSVKRNLQIIIIDLGHGRISIDSTYFAHANIRVCIQPITLQNKIR